MFEGVSGNEESAILKRLEMFQSIRLNRSAVTQLYSQIKLWEGRVSSKKDECLNWLSEDDLPPDGTAVRDWFFAYDVIKDTKGVLARL